MKKAPPKKDDKPKKGKDIYGKLNDAYTKMAKKDGPCR
jgi:hypothetical protein